MRMSTWIAPVMSVPRDALGPHESLDRTLSDRLEGAPCTQPHRAGTLGLRRRGHTGRWWESAGRVGAATLGAECGELAGGRWEHLQQSHGYTLPATEDPEGVEGGFTSTRLICIYWQCWDALARAPHTRGRHPEAGLGT